jgi:hypothetical protein
VFFFFFFNNRLGCAGSLLISVIGTGPAAPAGGPLPSSTALIGGAGGRKVGGALGVLSAGRVGV